MNATNEATVIALLDRHMVVLEQHTALIAKQQERIERLEDALAEATNERGVPWSGDSSLREVARRAAPETTGPEEDCG
jgi:hypothetical protein